MTVRLTRRGERVVMALSSLALGLLLVVLFIAAFDIYVP